MKFMFKNFLPIIIFIFFLSACSNQVEKKAVSAPNSELPGGLKVVEKQDEPAVEPEGFEEESCSSLEFVWNEELGVCARARDIQTEDQKRAAVLAIDNSDLGRGGLTIAEITPAACDGCYLVNLRQERDGNIKTERIIIDGWKVESVEPSEEKGSASAVNAEGVIKMMALELMNLIPEFMEIDQTILRWKLDGEEKQITAKSIKYGEGYGAREVFVTHQNILDGFKTLGFRQDELNSSSEDGIEISGFNKDRIVCSVIMSELGESELELRCGELGDR
jgi:hypothetical protein